MDITVLPACMSVRMCIVPEDAKEDIRPPKTRVTGGCDPPVGVGNYTQVLRRSSQCSKLLSQPFNAILSALNWG